MRRVLLNSAREKQAVPHPRDRSVRLLEKKEKRATKLEAQKTKLKTEQTLQLMRFFWFREQCIALGHTSAAVPEATVALLVRLYVDRNIAEVAALQAQRTPPLGRIKVLEATRQAEEDELQSAKGLRVPSLMDDDDVEILTQIWDGAPETVTVVPLTGFSMQRRPAPTDAALAELSRRLRPVAEVREEAPVTLPKRAVKFHAAAAVATTAGSGSRKAVSVKKADSSADGARRRVHAREEARQRKRQAEQRRLSMATRRHLRADDDE